MFAGAGFDEAGLEDTVLEGGRLTLAEGLAALQLRDDSDEAALVLARLFLGGEAIDARRAAAVLWPLSPDELTDVVTVRDGVMRARVKIEPFEGLLVASDPAYGSSDTVLGVGGITRMLAAITVRRPCAAALDLCTGSGALALLAARHADHAVGVDLNPRALQLARISAALNGCESIEWRCGDLFEPVGEERFDLVTANPPFVVSPSREFLFRDGAYEDDALSCAVVAGAAVRLQDGGFAHVVCNWIAPAHGSWSERPRSWVRDAGCDALLLRYRSESPLAYALRWNLSPGRTLVDAAVAAKPWLDYYAARGIDSIVTGAIVLRRRDGSNWVQEDELLRLPSHVAGDHVERIFAGKDALAAIANERELLDLVVAPAPGTMLVERRYPSGEPVRTRLSNEEGLPISARIPAACARVVAALDGRRSLREAIEIGDAVADECLPAMADLLARGLLVR